MTMLFKDLGQALINLQPAAAQIKETLIPAVSLVCGSWFILSGFISMVKIGDRSGGGGEGDSISGVLTRFVVGGFAISYGQTVSIANNMLALNGGMTYSPNTGSAYTDQVVSAIVFIVSVMGSYSIFAALLDAKKIGDGGHAGQDMVSKAIWKFVGGAVALNLGSFLQ